jgi:hypothetical protein
LGEDISTHSHYGEAKVFKNEVNSAFEILLEEIENVVEDFNQEGENAFKNRDYEKLKTLIENAMRLTSFREKVKNLQKEWRNIFGGKFPARMRKARGYKKLKRGLRTPEDDFRIPILKTLVELGGKAEMGEILKGISERMKGKLNKYDTEGLPSNPSQRRWENTAQWCRNTMVNEGLLSSASPRGVWEITAEGKKYFSNRSNKNLDYV